MFQKFSFSLVMLAGLCGVALSTGQLPGPVTSYLSGQAMVNLDLQQGAPQQALVPSNSPTVMAAVLSDHQIKFYDVPSTGSIIQATTIDVPANILPLNFVFRSASSQINLVNKHQGADGSFKETNSQDEPHKLVHTVTKPIIQEVREVISPFRRITQTVEPVQEKIQTLIARGVNKGYASSSLIGQELSASLLGGANNLKTDLLAQSDKKPTLEMSPLPADKQY